MNKEFFYLIKIKQHIVISVSSVEMQREKKSVLASFRLLSCVFPD